MPKNKYIRYDELTQLLAHNGYTKLKENYLAEIWSNGIDENAIALSLDQFHVSLDVARLILINAGLPEKQIEFYLEKW